MVMELGVKIAETVNPLAEAARQWESNTRNLVPHLFPQATYDSLPLVPKGLKGKASMAIANVQTLADFAVTKASYDYLAGTPGSTVRQELSKGGLCKLTMQALSLEVDPPTTTPDEKPKATVVRADDPRYEQYSKLIATRVKPGEVVSAIVLGPEKGVASISKDGHPSGFILFLPLQK